jgi:hypothetical protein
MFLNFWICDFLSFITLCLIDLIFFFNFEFQDFENILISFTPFNKFLEILDDKNLKSFKEVSGVFRNIQELSKK